MTISKNANGSFNVRAIFPNFNHCKTVTVYPDYYMNSFWHGELTEEGFKSISEQYYIENNSLYRSVYSAETGCDGRITHTMIQRWTASKNRWTTVERSQRDYRAEQAGY